MAVHDFLNAYLQPALKRSERRTIRLTWLMLTLFATAGAIFVLFKYPSAKEMLSTWAGRLANVVFPLIQEDESLAFLAPFVSWLPAIGMGIVVLLVTRALARPIGSLFLSQPPISGEFSTYSNRRVQEDANKLKGKLPDLVDYLRHCFFEVWNKDDAAPSGVPSDFSHEDAETALLQQEPVQTVADKVDFLTTAAANKANKSIHRLTERWLGLGVKQGIQTLLVWILVVSVLVSSLPRPVLVASVSAASKASVEAVIRNHPEVRVPESPVSPEDRMPALLKSELTKEEGSTDDQNVAAESTPLDEDDFDEFFSGEEEDLSAFTSIAPSLNDTIEEIEDGSGQSLGSLVFRPLDEEDEKELKEDLREGEKLARRVASGEVSEAEGSEIIAKAKDDMRRAEELRREAAKEAEEARALEAEAKKDREDAERAKTDANKLEQDAKYLESTSDALEREASEAEREAEELDPTASAEKLESEADALETERAKMQSEVERNSEEADKLEREAKADREEAKRLEDATSPDSEEKRKADERRDSAKEKDDLARKKREESEELKRKIDTNKEEAEKKRKRAADLKKRAEEEPSLAEDRLKADQKRLEAERKKKRAQELRDQAAKRKQESEQKKQEADKKNQEADGKEQKAEEKHESSKKKKRDAWKLARKAGIALAAMAIHPVLGLAAVYLMLSGKDSGSGGGSGGGSGDGEGKGDNDGPEGSESGTEGGESGTEGGESGTEGGESGTEGGESGTEGGESGTAGGESGTEGGESGTEGGESGTEGGESGTEGGESGTEGGESGTEGDESGQKVDVPSLASEGNDITWGKTGDGSFVAKSDSSSSEHTVGEIPKEFTDGSLKSVLFQDGDTAASRYLVAETAKGLYKFSPTGEASPIEHVVLDDLLDEAGAGLSSGGRILLELLTESGDFQLVHSKEFTTPDSKVVKAWFLYEADEERLHWILEPSVIEKRELDIRDDSLKKTLADQSSPQDISEDLANALDFIATRSKQLPASNLHRYIPLLKSTSDGFRVLMSLPQGGGEKQSISVFDPKTKTASIRGSLSRLAWATLLPPAGKPFESRAESVFFGDPIDDDFVLNEQPADWYAKGWGIVAVQLNAKESFSVVLRRESNTNEVLLRYLPPSGQADRKWLEAKLSDMSERYADRRKSVPLDYAEGKHPSVSFDVPVVDVRIFDSWVFQGMPSSYPAWGRKDKAEVFWLFDRD